MRHLVRTFIRLTFVALAVIVVATMFTHHMPNLSTLASGAAPSNDPATPYAYIDSRPTAWPACATINYQTDLSKAPANASAELTTALAKISAATGLHFVNIGDTQALPDVANYTGNGPTPPVTIAWVDGAPADSNSAWATTDPVTSGNNIITAQVQISDASNQVFATNNTFAQTLLLHELLHVVGLHDVTDPSVVEYYQASLASAHFTDLQPGDLAGLATLYHPGC